jgi:hypothetical protein
MRFFYYLCTLFGFVCQSPVCGETGSAFDVVRLAHFLEQETNYNTNFN